MAKIIGNIVGLPNPKPDWNQTDENKANYIKNKPNIGSLDDLATDDKSSLVAAINEAAKTGSSIFVQSTEPENASVGAVWVDTSVTSTINAEDVSF